MNVSTRARTRSTHRRGAIVHAALAGVVALGTLVGASMMAMPSRRQPPTPPPMSNSELEVALRRVQITPESLAAAGFSQAQVTALVARARATLSGEIVSFREAQAELAEARSAVDTLTRRVRSGLASEQEVTALAAARTSLTTATTAHDNWLASVFNSATDTSPQGQSVPSGAQVGTLTTVRGNSMWDMPVEYKTRTVTEAEWVALRDALAAERIALRDDDDVPQAAASLLLDWRGQTPVAAARTNLAELPTVQSAWAAAIAGGG